MLYEFSLHFRILGLHIKEFMHFILLCSREHTIPDGSKFLGNCRLGSADMSAHFTNWGRKTGQKKKSSFGFVK